MVANPDLQRKLGLKPGLPSYSLHAPAGYEKLLPLTTPLHSSEGLKGDVAWVQAFYTERAELEKEISMLQRCLAKDGQLWLCWPKKASGVKSDLSDSVIREIGLTAGLVDVKVVSIDEVWSGLKFIYRLSAR